MTINCTKMVMLNSKWGEFDEPLDKYLRRLSEGEKSLPFVEYVFCKETNQRLPYNLIPLMSRQNFANRAFQLLGFKSNPDIEIVNYYDHTLESLEITVDSTLTVSLEGNWYQRDCMNGSGSPFGHIYISDDKLKADEEKPLLPKNTDDAILVINTTSKPLGRNPDLFVRAFETIIPDDLFARELNRNFNNIDDLYVYSGLYQLTEYPHICIQCAIREFPGETHQLVEGVSLNFVKYISIIYLSLHKTHENFSKILNTIQIKAAA